MTILVAYATRHGSTRGIAETIAAELELYGHTTVFSEAARVGRVDGFDAVVLGSAVYMGRWLPAARELIETHRRELAALPVWLFSTGPLGDQPAQEPAGVAAIGAIDHVVFSGRLDRAALGIGERFVTRMVGAPEGDFRDWTEIRAWAGRIAHQMPSRQQPIPTSDPGVVSRLPHDLGPARRTAVLK